MAESEQLDALFAQGLKLQGKGDHAGAERIFKHLKDTQPRDPARLFQLGFSVEMQGRLEEAERLYQEIVAGTADEGGAEAGNAAFRIAWMAMHDSKHTKAAKWFDRSAQILERVPGGLELRQEAIYWLALSYEAMEQPLRALEWYATLLHSPNWFFDVSFRRGKCYDAIGEYEQALHCYRAFFAAAPANATAATRKAVLEAHVLSLLVMLEKIISEP